MALPFRPGERTDCHTRHATQACRIDSAAVRVQCHLDQIRIGKQLPVQHEIPLQGIISSYCYAVYDALLDIEVYRAHSAFAAIVVIGDRVEVIGRTAGKNAHDSVEIGIRDLKPEQSVGWSRPLVPYRMATSVFLPEELTRIRRGTVIRPVCATTCPVDGLRLGIRVVQLLPMRVKRHISGHDRLRSNDVSARCRCVPPSKDIGSGLGRNRQRTQRTPVHDGPLDLWQRIAAINVQDHGIEVRLLAVEHDIDCRIADAPAFQRSPERPRGVHPDCAPLFRVRIAKCADRNLLYR